MIRVSPPSYPIPILIILLYPKLPHPPLRYPSFILLLLLLCTCSSEEVAKERECHQLPVGTHLPRLFSSEDGVLLSLVQTQEKESSLLFQLLSTTATDSFPIHHLRSGDDWFINWADFPSVVRFKDKQGHEAQFSHWLKYSGKGTYDYDIFSAIEYFQVEEAFKLHTDTISAEHGFLSSTQLPQGGLQVTWLDGRRTKQGAAAGAENGHGHGGGAMTLRTKALSDSVSVELDHRVCDCCNTATVATDSLIMVAYRDRSEHEIRDIAYVMKRPDEEWSIPKLVHADNWEINGCPVNGPALASNVRGDIALVWYTASRARARIHFARYDAINDAFTTPLTLDDRDPPGRLDLQLAADGTAYALGLTATKQTDSAALTLWTISSTNEVQREELAITAAARSSGFPRIALYQDRLFWARTVLGAEKGKQYVEVCSQAQ